MAAQGYRDRPDWDLRPWLLAGIGALAGITIHLILGDGPFYANPPGALKTAAAAFVGSLAVLVGFTLERERWQWAGIFSLVAASAIALIFYWNGAPDDWSGGDGWRILCIFLAVAIAAPLFQAARDEGARRFPYAEVHGHAWTNVVIWAAGWVFVGTVFLLALLLSELFALIKITLLKDLLDEDWFWLTLMGASFGAAIGILRERDNIVRLLQRVVVAVLGVLAPVLGVGLVLFLASLPFTGLSALWDATKATTPILLSCIVGALILANAVIGNGEEDEARFPPLRYGAMALAVAMLPLGIIAAISTGLRIGQYGFTPDRLWAAVFVLVALAYGLAYLATFLLKRDGWATAIRPINLKLAFGLCALALFLSLPILSFNAISTRDQVARLESGKVTPAKFDWAALRYDFGDAGRKALDRLAKSASPAIRDQAAKTLKAEDRWALRNDQEEKATARKVEKQIRIFPQQVPLPEGLVESLDAHPNDDAIYALHYRPGDRSAVLIAIACRTCDPRVTASYLGDDGKWQSQSPQNALASKIERNPRTGEPNETRRAAIEKGSFEIRDISRRQVFVDGKPVGDVFE